jgi:lambda repressor-like predicted transcriptional regulator
MTTAIAAVRRVTTGAAAAAAALVVTRVVMPPRVSARQEPAGWPGRGGDDMHDTNTLDAHADPVAAFRDNRDRLGRIIGAAVTAGTPGCPGYRVELRDHRGARLSVSGTRPGSQSDEAGWVLQVLLEAGFAPEIAAAVRTHRVVRLARTSDGTTSLEQATSAQPAAVGSTTGASARDPRPATGSAASCGDTHAAFVLAQRQEPGDPAVTGAAQFPAAPARRVINAFASGQRITLAQAAGQLRLDAALVQAVFHRRWIPWEAADAIAVALGRHPCDLWPEWFPPEPTAAGASRS